MLKHTRLFGSLLLVAAAACARRGMAPTPAPASVKPPTHFLGSWQDHDRYARAAGLRPLRAEPDSESDEVRVLLVRYWGEPEYLLRLKSDRDGVHGWVYRFGSVGPENRRFLAAAELPNAERVKEELDSLSVSGLVAPDANDGACLDIGPGHGICRMLVDAQDLFVEVRSGAQYRFRAYNAPESRTAAVAKRATRLAAFVFALGEAIWPTAAK